MILLMAVAIVFLIAGNWNAWTSEKGEQETDDVGGWVCEGGDDQSGAPAPGRGVDLRAVVEQEADFGGI